MIKCLLINGVKDEYVPELTYFDQWANAIKHKNECEITIKITTPEEMRSYNKLYKNQDKVSDTLAFPADNVTVENKIILGDIAMCANKINLDSITFKKEKSDRWAHLLVHSTLHLLGYTHDNKIDQEYMEKKEIDILKKFNIFNPYEI